ncbi:gliding motility-associated peptidyl-prolyl isomerase GldI [Flavobacterium sp. Fl-77]|uniref:Peptidyl-prolyl cis-trans isomerase n=1 Tax=Flavobacterium flavipigmentatum TaxID=2893884 RepID=A0AAJ2VVT7_9FLAO|nr:MULTISPECIES: gliding motility-associated peptidyl-prolyl isomerase GldI [unclassified Flavobacterium]MDX6181809.1 gliding motility-associated peptidyl-prolyl isomerase GldI [Flavobacterium sp. Fl-33]MDX6185157.1 gliding motility-associated peptidyl-prolyl isomerase GldI [Flavobacterium sp. Fl-77]UFH37264.1 gliding motility-associated peptidyl-prolyl isomerase GldI [Flavobacterium sp. F-70]
MNYLKISIYTLLFIVLLASCKHHEEARKPISRASGSFMKKSADRNKKLVATEEDIIKKIIKSNPKVKYFASKKGYWYHYEERNLTDTLKPKRGDIAYYNLEIRDIKGAVIYSEADLGPQTYYVDKQDIMMGLRDGIKLMHKNEIVTFLFPSHIAYGYHGDNKKIGTNESLMCTVSLRNFVSEEASKTVTSGTPITKTTVVKPITITKKDTLNP